MTFTCTNHESKFPRAVNSTPRRMTSKNFVMLLSQRLLAGNGFIAEKDEFLTQKAQKEKSKYCYMSCDPEVIKESARCWGKDPATFNFISFAGMYTPLKMLWYKMSCCCYLLNNSNKTYLFPVNF